MTEPSTENAAAPILEDLFTDPAPDGATRIIASSCPRCGEVFFPPRSICAACSHRSLEATMLGPEGRLHTYTIQRNPGRIPDFKEYAVGQVDFGAARVQGPLDVASFDEIVLDMPVEAYVRVVAKTETGADQLSYAFRPRR